MSPRMPSVLHITNIPTPYRLPLFREITRQAARRGIGFRVHFLGLVRRDRRWRISEEDFEGIDYTIAARPTAAEAVRAIEAARPSVVVLAWAMDLAALRLLLYCRRHRIPCVVVSGETDRSAAANSMPALRSIFRLPFFRLADGFVSYGTQSSRYLVGAGVPAERVTTGINVVDTTFFSQRVDELRRTGRAGELRARHRGPGGEEFACHLLFVGYLLPEKGGVELVEAVARLGRADVALHVVGAGEQLEAMRSLAAARGIAGRAGADGFSSGRHRAQVGDDQVGLVVGVGAGGHGGAGNAFLDDSREVSVGLSATEAIGGEIHACDLVAISAVTVGATGEIEHAAALKIGWRDAMAFLRKCRRRGERQGQKRPPEAQFTFQ